MDKELLFFFISIFILFGYRTILSILLLNKKKYLIDEKFFVSLFYISLVDIIVLLSKNITVGIILVLLLPVVLTLYVALIPQRIYWIINGYDISTSTFYRGFKEMDSRYEDLHYTNDAVRFSQKKDEKTNKVIICCKDYKDKEAIKNRIITICHDNCLKSNKREIIQLVISILVMLVCLIGVIIVLFG